MAKPNRNPDQPTLPGIELDLQQKLDFAKPPAPRVAAKAAVSEDGPSNIGKAVKLPVPDFSDPRRPKTCLEVDFPIVPINELSALEGNAGKPIYQMSKWWARRRSSVFRAMLIAAATQAPIRTNPDGTPILDADGIPVPDETEAAKAVWDVYYANHQKAGNFRHLRVLDCFMGGGTTLVEGSRLGFQVAGVDLNPVAWFVVKNELACTDPDEVRKFFDQIEAEVKPVIQPFYVADCPRGHKGRWYEVAGTDDPAADHLMPDDFDPLALAPEARRAYRYEGPETIYTFWAKHGQCTKPRCGHRTPMFRSPVIAEKKLGVKYIALTCKSCKTAFHAELGAARMAPAAERVVLESEFPFTELSQPFALRLLEYAKGHRGEKKQRAAELYEMVDREPGLRCPKCDAFAGQYLRDVLNGHRQASTAAAIDKKHLRIEPARNGTKHVFCYLLVDPQWLTGAPGVVAGVELGGYPDAPLETTERWYQQRLENLRLIEVRGRIKLSGDTSTLAGNAPIGEGAADDEPPATDADEGGEAPEADRKLYGLPHFITLRDGRRIDTRRGTIPKPSHFICGKCGAQQDFRIATEASGHAAPLAVYAVQCHCRECDGEARIYGGRYFGTFDSEASDRLIGSEREWLGRRDMDLTNFWPRDEIPPTYMTHQANFALPRQGFTHWWKMFNSRQLLVLASILRRILIAEKADVRHQGLGAIQQYVRNENMFCIWDISRDCLAPLLSNPNFAPKSLTIENSVFGHLGRGNWTSTVEKIAEGLEWALSPWEIAGALHRDEHGKARVPLDDAILPGSEIECSSSSELPFYADKSFDLVITDPPFGDNVFYSDLANFFHVWLRLGLCDEYPKLFARSQTPSLQEALAPRTMTEDEANEHYRVRLTACWSEAYRVLKDGGLLAFTFHHSEDSQWAVVLESLFDAGFILQQTFPIASDEQKGEGGQFGAKGTEYDIIHVCRKRLDEPTPVSWPKMRQWVKAELNRLRRLLEAYHAADLPEADIRVILRGKALEFYSRHYGQVFTVGGEGERVSLTIQHALGGINQLLDEDTGDAADRPPTIVQPVAYQYLRLFSVRPSLAADDVSKSLFGTAIRQRDFEDRGWVRQQNRRVEAVSPRERFEICRRRPRKEMKTEIDQAHFLIGGAMPGSGLDLEKELTKDTWMVRPSVAAVLDWYARSAAEPEVRQAAQLAAEILRLTKDKLRQQPEATDQQRLLFSQWEDEEW